MEFFKKSLANKTVLILFATLVLGALAQDVFIPYAQEYLLDFERTELLISLLPVAPLIIFFFVASFVIFWGVEHPLGKVFQEMKAYLAGRPYRKIFTKRIDEMGVLAHFFNDVTRGLEKAKLALAEGRRMSEELSVGSEIQKRILPTAMPIIAGLTLFGATRPASEVGGDSFDVIETRDNTYLYVGDVAGHGIPAALIMVMVNTIMLTLSETSASGYDLLVNTNRILKQQIEPRRFMTCVLLRWSLKEQKLYYTGAGHEHIVIFRKKTGDCEVRQTGGVALGMVPDISKIAREEAIPLESGDAIVLYSDGIIEAKNVEGEMFGLERLKASVKAHAGSAKPNELFTLISKDFALFVGEQVQEDDITLIALLRM